MGLSVERIEAHVRKLVEEIGPRTVGSREDGMAIEYIAGALREWGCEVGFHEVACPCWQHRSTSLTLLSSGESIPAQGCQYSAACDIVGEVAPIETMGEANDAPVAGKVCLMSAGVGRGVTLLNLIALALEARGAMGLIVNRDHANPDAFDGKVVREPDLRRMPVASVSRNSAERILASQSPVRLCIDASFWHGRTRNVQGVIPGAGPGRIFLTAHRDTGAGAPGAADDGASVAILLEIARLFSEEVPPCELRFVFTGAHERLGQGSKDYVRDNRELLEDAVMDLNFDGVGPRGGAPEALMSGSEALIERFKKTLPPDVAWEVNTAEPGRMGGDAGAFAKEGLPAVWFRTYPKGRGSTLFHTQLDDMTTLDMDLVAGAATAAVEAIRSEFWRK